MYASQRTQRNDDSEPRPIFEVPVVEIEIDTFGDLLDHAAPELVRSRLSVEDDDLAAGDLVRLEIRLRDRPAVVRGLGRIEEVPGEGHPRRRLSLSYLDPASDRLIGSIRQRYPAAEERDGGGAGPEPAAESHLEQETGEPAPSAARAAAPAEPPTDAAERSISGSTVGLGFGESVAVTTGLRHRFVRFTALGALVLVAILAGWVLLRDGEPGSAPVASRSAEGPSESRLEAPAPVELESSAPPAEPDPPPEPRTDPRTEIENAIRSWAAAWSEQRVDDYLGWYAAGYSPPGMSRDAWRRQRRSRIEAPSTISIDVDPIEISRIDDGLAAASFFQTYVADSKRRTTWKTFELVRDTDGWKIHRETLGRRPRPTPEAGVR